LFKRPLRRLPVVLRFWISIHVTLPPSVISPCATRGAAYESIATERGSNPPAPGRTCQPSEGVRALRALDRTPPRR
jgi:hypothetical protein